MNQLYRDAILKASQVRKQLKLNMFQPINIFDSCTAMGVNVKFVEINMDGFYVEKAGMSTILISNQRPLPRRCFTCGHELGHHVFGHGSKLDALLEEGSEDAPKDKDEVLVDAFSAALLMPVGGIQAEFIKRNWSFHDASPYDFYTICSIFGVGYQTLITHCKVNGLINEAKMSALLKLTPGKIFKNRFGETGNKSYFRVIDEFFDLSLIDIEVSSYVVTPLGFNINPDYLEKVFEGNFECLYVARKAGISSAHSPNGKSSYFIRIQPEKYKGFAEYRHFES